MTCLLGVQKYHQYFINLYLQYLRIKLIYIDKDKFELQTKKQKF